MFYTLIIRSLPIYARLRIFYSIISNFDEVMLY